MDITVRGETSGYVPGRFYLEFDLAIKVQPASPNCRLGSEVLGPENDDGDIPESLRLKMDTNFVQAKEALLALLDARGVAVLDGERSCGPGDHDYLVRKRHQHWEAAAGLSAGEPVHDRFWQIHRGATTQICPPPEPVDSPNSQDATAYSLDYEYAGLVIKSPAMDCHGLDRGSDALFLQEASNSLDSWTGRVAGEGCTWKEVKHVLRLLNSWCFEDKDRSFTIVAPKSGVRDNGTNTSLRILMGCGHLSALDVQYGHVLAMRHGGMSFHQMKKITLFMWFFEEHLHTLCHPHQAVIRGQSEAFPHWARYGPLSRSLSYLSVAALKGCGMELAIPGSTLNAMLQYVPRTMFHAMVEYKKLSKVWETSRPKDLVERLRINGTVTLDEEEPAVSSINWPVLRFDSSPGRDIYHRELYSPFVSIGGFQCAPFDVFLFRASAQLVQCCVRATRLPRRDFQELLGGIYSTAPENALQLVDILGVDVDVWKHYMEEYPRYWASS